MRRKRAAIVLGMSCILMASAVLQGCQQNPKSGKVEIELVQYKPEAVDIFEQLEKEFNESMDGRFRRPGMNLFLFARRFRMKESIHFILDIKIPGPALHLGMPLQSDLHHPMFVSR